ncbi:hypothetical protein BHF70_02150 [Anaerostipes sp. 494a]|nr:hypothetical protein BHF70_02150 [Anaerostipes sp. 494a]
MRSFIIFELIKKIKTIFWHSTEKKVKDSRQLAVSKEVFSDNDSGVSQNIESDSTFIVKNETVLPEDDNIMLLETDMDDCASETPIESFEIQKNSDVIELEKLLSSENVVGDAEAMVSEKADLDEEVIAKSNTDLIEEDFHKDEEKTLDEVLVDKNVSTYSRKELEKMYQDEIKLIVHPLNSINLKLLHMVEDKNEYTHLRNRILQEFLDVKLLCEIEINDKEYEILCDYFKKQYLFIRRDVGHSIIDVLFSVALVQIGIRNYDGNFWKHIAKVLWDKDDKNIPVNQRTWIGGTFTETMMGFGKPIFKETEYVTNIMMHCFVADKFLPKFFEYLFQYYNLDMERDISSGVEEESRYICDSIKNPYAKRKQFLSNYLYLTVRGNQIYCQKLIGSLLKLIDQSFWDEYIEEVDNCRIIDNFEKWKLETNYFRDEKRKLRNSIAANKRIKNFRSPHLVCDMESIKFQVILPAQNLPIDIGDVQVEWQINSKKCRTVPCDIQEGYLGKKTKEIAIPIENNEIFSPFKFTLFVNNQEVRNFVWKKHILNFFHAEGEWIKGENLPEGMIYAFAEAGTQIEADGLLNVSVRQGLNFYEFNLTAGDLISVAGGENYYVGEIQSTGLLNEYKIDGMLFENEGKKVSVYNRLPTLIIDVEDNKFNGTAVIINDKITKLSEKKFFRISHGKQDSRKFYYIDLKSMEGICEGINKIVIDFPASTRKICCEFGYFPEFKYMFEDAPYIYMNRGTLSFNRKLEKGMIFANSEEENQKYDFELDVIKSNCLVMPVQFKKGIVDAEFKVPVFLYSWDKEIWSLQRARDIWHSEMRDTVYINYPATRIALSIRGREEDKPYIVFNRNLEDLFECDLTKLKTYLDKNKMMQTITMVCQGNEYDVLRIVMRSFLKSALLEVDYEKDCVLGTFDIIGKGEYYVDILCEKELLVEKRYIDGNAIELNIPIRSAMYMVRVYEIEGDEFSFDEEYTLIGENTVKLVDPKELEGTCIRLNSIILANNQDQHLELSYEYMFFVKKRVSGHKYLGMMVELFHKNNIKNASVVMIDIPNLNVATCMTIVFVDNKDGDEYEFLYDSYSKRIVENENPRYSKSEAYRRYEHVLYSDAYLWNVQFIEKNKDIMDKGYGWIKNHQTIKENRSIWKKDLIFEDIPID